MWPKRILILGGTGLAREAANRVVGLGHDVTTSYAGVTENPILPQGKIRRGGFGGVVGLRRHLTEARYDVIVDATHAFAEQMSQHAFEACSADSVPLLRLESRPWQKQAGDHWISTQSISQSVGLLPQDARVAVTVGRKEIGAYFNRNDVSGVARMIEPPDVEVPSAWWIVLERPPFTVESEIDFLQHHKAQFLVSKNAGGPRPAKLDAAAKLALPVIMIERPTKPKVITFHTLEDLLGSPELND